MDAIVSEVRSLGCFSLTIGGRPVERWRAGRARDLLQFLLIRPGRVVSREGLCDALWPGCSGSASHSSVKVAVHTLRRILADHVRAARLSADPPLRLVTCQEGYVLEVNRCRIDFQQFDELIDRGHRLELGGHGEDAVACYREAIELYTADFLSGVDAEWARVHREWLRSRYLYALQQMAKAALAEDDPLSVMRWCRFMIDIEPFHEEAYRALMVAHSRLGQLSQVRRWYQMCSERLNDELDISPSPETDQIYAQALRGTVMVDQKTAFHQRIPYPRR